MAQREEPARSGDYDALYHSYVSALKEVDHLSTLREIALAINESIELNEVLPIVATVVQGALDVSKLTIFEIDKRKGSAQPVIARYGRDLISKERLSEETQPISGTPLEDAIETRSPILVSNAYRNEAYIPLIAKSIPLGVMRLEDRGDGVPFSQDDAPLYRTIGSMIALAINNAQLYAMAVTDGLTGLYVRRYFDLRMEEELDQATRYGREFALLLFDIDHFKKFNDTHGHQTGDMVLQQVANLLRDNTRKSDICCRYGGEEMAVILPETNDEDATLLAKKLCRTIRHHPFEGMETGTLQVTTSIGVVAFQKELRSVQAMVEAADTALYKAKAGGRDRVEVAVRPGD